MTTPNQALKVISSHQELIEHMEAIETSTGVDKDAKYTYMTFDESAHFEEAFAECDGDFGIFGGSTIEQDAKQAWASDLIEMFEAEFTIRLDDNDFFFGLYQS